MENNELISATKNSIDLEGIAFSIMDVDKFINTFKLLPVTSLNIKDSMGTNFDPEGLFSEIIFGAKNDSKRFVNLGFIRLYVKILHPYIYKRLVEADKIVGKLLNGTRCRWNPDTKKFELASEEDMGEFVGKGMSFFKKFEKEYIIDKSSTTSIRKQAGIEVLNRFRDRWFIDKCIVLPAGIRDIHEEDGRISKDDINNLYINLMSLSNTFEYIPKNDRETNPLYNDIILNIQKKVNSIFDYLFNFISGKYGFLQRKFGTRAVAGSTRNVIIANHMSSDNYDDPNFLGARKIQLPFIEVVKELSHFMAHAFIELTNQVTGIKDSNRIVAIDDKTFELTHIEVPIKERERFTNPDKINNIFNLFLKREFRYTPVTIKNRSGKEYGILLVYDDVKTDKLFISNNKDHLIKFANNHITNFDINKIRFITYYEYLYLMGLNIASKKRTTICRYPITSKWSHQEGEVLIATTTPSRDVRVYLITGDIDNSEVSVLNSSFSSKKDEYTKYPLILKTEPSYVLLNYPNWPDIYNGRAIDGIAVNNVWLSELGADFDGDTMSSYTALSNEANEELDKFINSPERLVSLGLTFIPNVKSGSVGELLKYITK